MMESELKDCQIWAVVASMVWMAQGGTDVEVLLVLLVVVTKAVQWWRRMVASMVVDTEGIDVEARLCPQR